ncbi:MAG: tetratricopeptide repeat protein, partial [Candidatus Omnitrophica bacterium]|nr:tetratricopeptide repeat protein [Candidatus Omnitrophota bacterium]
FSTLYKRVPGFFVAIANYFSLLFVPLNLHMEYGQKLFTFANPRAILGMAILFLFLTYAFLKRHNDRLVFFAILWFFVALLPVSNLYPINAYMAEHWLYLPSVSFFLILGYGLTSMYNIKKLRYFALIFLISILCIYSYLTIKQNSYWEESIAFYNRTLRYAPDSARIYYNLGRTYSGMGMRYKAIDSYKKAIEIDPTYAYAYNNLGVEYKEMGKKGDAISLFKKAIELNPNCQQPYKNLCSIYANIGREKEAIAIYKKWPGENLSNAEIYNKVALIYHDNGKDDEAIELLNKAIEIDPTYIPAYNNLGVIYALSGRKKDIIHLFKKAIEINPTYAKAYNNLAVAYFEEKQYEVAIEYCNKAKKLGYANRTLLELLKPYRK